MLIARTPPPPYYAVIFSSIKTKDDQDYDTTAALMVQLAEQQEGFLGIESVRNELGITVSYWRDKTAIHAWKTQLDHQLAQQRGRAQWYKCYKIRIAKVERDSDFVVSDHK